MARSSRILRWPPGITPADSIASTTPTSASATGGRYFRADDRLGTIEPGKRADLFLVEGDPSRDIKVLKEVRRVMLNGSWVPELAPTK